MMSRRSLLGVMFPSLVLVAGFAAAQAPAPAPAPAVAPVVAPAAPSIPRALDVPDNALVAAGKAPEVDLLYTGDVIGFIEPCG
jgi:hypothetical protein